MNRWAEMDEKSRRKTIIFLVLVGLALLWLTWPDTPNPAPKHPANRRAMATMPTRLAKEIANANS